LANPRQILNNLALDFSRLCFVSAPAKILYFRARLSWAGFAVLKAVTPNGSVKIFSGASDHFIFFRSWFITNAILGLFSNPAQTVCSNLRA